MYRKLFKLGGPFSSTFLAIDGGSKIIVKEYGRKSELKWSLLDYYRHQRRRYFISGIKRMENEVEMMRLVSKIGVNTPEILEANRSERFLKMEYIKGKNLKKEPSRANLSEVGSILSRLHSQDVVLRDCKLENFIVVDSNNTFGFGGKIYLTDLEQASSSKKGLDKAWDLNQLICFMAHDGKREGTLKESTLDRKVESLLNGYSENELKKIVDDMGCWEHLIVFSPYFLWGLKFNYLEKLTEIRKECVNYRYSF